MKILSITAQKPGGTGSGVYLTELVKACASEGHEQAVIAGITKEDEVELPEGAAFYPVYFESRELPFSVVGMSDEMPYRSTRYCDMTDEMAKQFKESFLKAADRAAAEFEPDLILCHHLYLLTALMREHFPGRKIYGFCHNTDLRQMQKTDLRREYIAEQIRGLDGIFVPQRAQESGVMEIYDADPARVKVLGMGYNSQIFRPDGERPQDGAVRIVYAGKIAEKKGVMSLIRSLSLLPCKKEELQIDLAGSAGNQTEYEEIRRLAEECPYDIHFLGRLSQEELAKVYNRSDVFVLPSFFDGLPLTVIEALACGDRVVVTDLPGVRDWIEENTDGADVRYVPLPEIRNTDEAVPESLPAFEKRLADALLESIRSENRNLADVSQISWKRIARDVLEMS